MGEKKKGERAWAGKSRWRGVGSDPTARERGEGRPVGGWLERPGLHEDWKLDTVLDLHDTMAITG